VDVRVDDRQLTPHQIVVELDGEYDIAGRHALARRLFDAATAIRPGVVFVLDLRAVTFVDSSALSCFVQVQRVVAARRGRLLTLCLWGSAVHRTIALTHLEDTLNLTAG
jgi:anti-anti-sigma factor